MPFYCYEDVETGEQVSLFRHVADRNNVPANLKLIIVPGHGGPVFKSPDPSSVDVAVPRAYRQLEQTMPASEIIKNSSFTTNDIKRIWKM
jgi:hypothetical protein